MSWKMILVMKSPGICWDADAHVPLVIVIRSYSDKTFFFTTCDTDEHCSMDATVTLLYVE